MKSTFAFDNLFALLRARSPSRHDRRGGCARSPAPPPPTHARYLFIYLFIGPGRVFHSKLRSCAVQAAPSLARVVVEENAHTLPPRSTLGRLQARSSYRVVKLQGHTPPGQGHRCDTRRHNDGEDVPAEPRPSTRTARGTWRTMTRKPGPRGRMFNKASAFNQDLGWCVNDDDLERSRGPSARRRRARRRRRVDDVAYYQRPIDDKIDKAAPTTPTALMATRASRGASASDPAKVEKESRGASARTASRRTMPPPPRLLRRPTRLCYHVASEDV